MVGGRRTRPGRGIGSLRRYEQTPESLEADKFLRTPQWKRVVALLLPPKGWSVCYLCDHNGWHSDGMALDHVIPRTECEARGISPYDLKNLKPVHHSRPCPTCHQRCNLVKGSGSVARAQKILARRYAELLAGHGDQDAELPPPDNGRW